MPHLSAADFHHQTVLGYHTEWSFLEHPTLGDEHPLLAIRQGDDRVYNTGDFDLPEYP